MDKVKIVGSGTNPHLTPHEAQAVLALSGSEHWQPFMAYWQRVYANSQRQCETVKDDHRYHQGGAVKLLDMVIIESKAKNILGGI